MGMAWTSRHHQLLALLAVAISLRSGVVAAQAAVSPAELRASHAFDAAKKLETPDLYAFLKPMPKGAELHFHLSGSVYAETFLDEAVRQGNCVNPVEARFVPPVTGKEAPCGAGNLVAADAVKDQRLYDRLINTLSMRNFVPSAGFSGHDKFFSGGRNNGPTGFLGEWLAEVVMRAADQNELYLEIMASPTFHKQMSLTATMPWPQADATSVTAEELERMRKQLIAAGIFDEIPAGMKEMDAGEATQRSIVKCTGPATPPSPCAIKTHYIYTVTRGSAPEQVFAQALIGFELNKRDPRFVGMNIAAPEDGRISMRDYHLHMQMFGFLHSLYPGVHLSLHAGELAPGLVPPEGLRFHIREAIELGHAERIGHGVDVLYEDDAKALLKQMADKHIMVEINLTSNDGILGVKGADHPLSGYLAAHVPVALSTDDEGNSRVDLTHEYVKGAEEQHLTYADLKKMARTSFEHSFLPGESLWAAPDVFTKRRPACAAPITPTSSPNPECAALLKTSERATEQWELERRYAIFEAAQ